MTTHYFFPTASAYPLNHCLYLLKSDPAFRARYMADQDAAVAELGLDAPARAALKAGERDRLIALGAHPYVSAQLEGNRSVEVGVMTLVVWPATCSIRIRTENRMKQGGRLRVARRPP